MRESIRQKVARMTAPTSDEDLLAAKRTLERQHPRTPLTRWALGKAWDEVDRRGLYDDHADSEE